MRKWSLPFPTSCDWNTANEVGGKKECSKEIKLYSQKEVSPDMHQHPAPSSQAWDQSWVLISEGWLALSWLTLSSHPGYLPHIRYLTVPSLSAFAARWSGIHLSWPQRTLCSMGDWKKQTKFFFWARQVGPKVPVLITEIAGGAGSSWQRFLIRMARLQMWSWRESM